MDVVAGLRPRRGALVALVLLSLIYAWIWVVSAHRIDGQPFSGFAHVFITNCGDFEHFYHAARAMRDGGPLYGSGVQGYIYPPLIAFLFMPLTLLPVKDAALVMLALNLTMGLACAWLAAREVIRRFQIELSAEAVLIVAAVATLLVATRLRSEFQMWQTNVPMMLLMLLALRWLDPRPQLAGLSLGMAVSIKYLPLLFLPYLLLRRRFAAAAWMLAGIVGFALLPALASGWRANLLDLQVALSGLLQLLGFAAVSAQSAHVDPITIGHSVSITSAISRLLGPGAAPGLALLIAGVVALAVLGAVVRVYAMAKRPLLRWPNAATQATQPYLGIVALEWMALMVFALAFSPQTNPRHTSLLLMVAAPLAAMLCFPRPGVPRWPLWTATAVMLFGLLFPPNTAALAGILNIWRTLGGTGWCLALMLPLVFVAGFRYLAAPHRSLSLADGGEPPPAAPGSAPAFERAA